MFISKEEKERSVIDLYSQGKTYRQIAEQVRISPNDIHAILKKKEEQEKNNSIVTNKQQQSSSLSTKAYELFSQGKTPLQVAISLNIRQSDATKYYREYWKLRGLHKLDYLYVKTNGKIWPLWKLYKQLIKQKGMSIEQVTSVVEIAIHRLPYMETLYGQAKDQAEKMQCTIQRLVNDISALKYKLSILDKTACHFYIHVYVHMILSLAPWKVGIADLSS
jgi:predicted transcriptional regulator